mgnify:CR=1 FL=1
MSGQLTPLAGFLLIDKPYGMSSAHVVAKIRRRFKCKVGHTGTLDPLATGMLVLSVGDATKFARFSITQDKSYHATVAFGYTTDSGDLDGTIVQYGPTPKLTQAQIQQILISDFTGDILQTPPKFSALKYKGRPYYYYARRGIPIPIEQRSTCIHKYDNITFTPPTLTLDVTCSSGTYIRSLACDLGRQLGGYSCLIQLRRHYVAPWCAQQMLELDQVLASDTLAGLLRPMDETLYHLAAATITPAQYHSLRQGQYITIQSSKEDCADKVFIRVYCSDKFCGIIAKVDDDLYKPVKVITCSV